MVTLQQLQQKRARFARVHLGRDPRGGLHRRHDGARAGHHPRPQRVRGVRVRRDKRRASLDGQRRVRQLGVRERDVLADDNRADVVVQEHILPVRLSALHGVEHAGVHLDLHVVELVDDAAASHHESLLGELARLQVRRRRERRGEDLLLLHGDAELLELVHVLLTALVAVVGDEHQPLALLAKQRDGLASAGQQRVALPDDPVAVHHDAVHVRQTHAVIQEQRVRVRGERAGGGQASGRGASTNVT